NYQSELIRKGLVSCYEHAMRVLQDFRCKCNTIRDNLTYWEDEMRILLSSHFFHPSIGGIEQVSLTLATEFAHANHSVKVITSTMGTGNSVFPFEIIRQ